MKKLALFVSAIAFIIVGGVVSGSGVAMADPKVSWLDNGAFLAMCKIGKCPTNCLEMAQSLPTYKDFLISQCHTRASLSIDTCTYFLNSNPGFFCQQVCSTGCKAAEQEVDNTKNQIKHKVDSIIHDF